MERQRNQSGQFVAEHNENKTKLHRIWSAMRERCGDVHNKRYANYGGRGIKVCDEWQDYRTFSKWAKANGYTEGLTIDRIDFNGNYEPENCRWATRKMQNRNYSRNHFITYNGKTQCAQDWAEETGIKAVTILWRLKHGKTIQQALTPGDFRATR